MLEILEYTAEFVLIWIALSGIKIWYYRRQRKKNPNYPFGIESGDEQ